MTMIENFAHKNIASDSDKTVFDELHSLVERYIIVCNSTTLPYNKTIAMGIVAEINIEQLKKEKQPGDVTFVERLVSTLIMNYEKDIAIWGLARRKGTKIGIFWESMAISIGYSTTSPAVDGNMIVMTLGALTVATFVIHRYFRGN